MKKVLVTGSEGYIGKHLLKLLDQYNVTTVDILDPINPIDIRKDMQIEDEFDTVIHLAALVKVNESVENPADYYNTNIFGTINVLNQIKFKNFVFASTGTAEQPSCPYALSKRCCEDIVEEYAKKNNKTFTSFRFYNVIGTDGFPPTNPDGLFYNLIKAEKTGSFNLYGTDYNTPDGTCIRDYVHVNEICHALRDAVDLPANRIENLGHGKGFTVKEIIDLYKKVNNCDFEINEMPKRDGDLEKTVLEDVSSYMKTLYTMEELCKRWLVASTKIF